MEIGKLPNDILEKIVFDNIKNKREEVLVGSGIGEDNAIVDFGEEVCVMSTDPITGATKDVGRLAIHISCNDVASSGAEPIGALLTILAPAGTSQEDIGRIMKEANEAARELNIEIMGGHTEITDAGNRVVISTTVIGKQKKKDMLDPSQVQPGDKVLITKYAAIEGTAILAKEREDFLKENISREELIEAQRLGELVSVVKEGILLGEIGVDYMHDITEGGILGAVWEGAMAVGKGIKIYQEQIPIKDISLKIADLLEINPYKLISSGSMLVIAKADKVKEIEEKLEKENIKISVIGEVIEEGIFIERAGRIEKILSPEADELYRALQF